MGVFETSSRMRILRRDIVQFPHRPGLFENRLSKSCTVVVTIRGKSSFVQPSVAGCTLHLDGHPRASRLGCGVPVRNVRRISYPVHLRILVDDACIGQRNDRPAKTMLTVTSCVGQCESESAPRFPASGGDR